MMRNIRILIITINLAERDAVGALYLTEDSVMIHLYSPPHKNRARGTFTYIINFKALLLIHGGNSNNGDEVIENLKSPLSRMKLVWLQRKVRILQRHSLEESISLNGTYFYFSPHYQIILSPFGGNFTAIGGKISLVQPLTGPSLNTQYRDKYSFCFIVLKGKQLNTKKRSVSLFKLIRN